MFMGLDMRSKKIPVWYRRVNAFKSNNRWF